MTPGPTAKIEPDDWFAARPMGYGLTETITVHLAQVWESEAGS